MLDLPTPSFIVDLGVARANCERMLAKAAAAGVVFRPHVKTHKTLEGARLQHGGRVGPITVSTLAEAEFFAEAGFDDLTYAVPVAPSKLDRCIAIGKRVRTLNLLVDHPGAVDPIEERSRSTGHIFDVMLKVDCGYHRAGVDPDDPASIALALRIARSPAIRFRGLLTHAGHSYKAASRREILAAADDECGAVNRMRRALAEAGIASVSRSVGSTPTTSVAPIVDVDEIRPGNYIFYDAYQAAIGSCATSDCAAWVLASVISAHPERGETVIDAGALALSKDAGATHVNAACGFGLVSRCDGSAAGGVVTSLSQEHGIVRWPPGSVPGSIGDRVRVVPNHSCLTAALFDRYHVVENGVVVDEWRPARGW